MAGALRRDNPGAAEAVTLVRCVEALLCAHMLAGSNELLSCAAAQLHVAEFPLAVMFADALREPRSQRPRPSQRTTHPLLSAPSVCRRAMRESNLPKFLNQDAALFAAIIGDLFPGLEVIDQVRRAQFVTPSAMPSNLCPRPALLSVAARNDTFSWQQQFMWRA